MGEAQARGEPREGAQEERRPKDDEEQQQQRQRNHQQQGLTRVHQAGCAPEDQVEGSKEKRRQRLDQVQVEMS